MANGCNEDERRETINELSDLLREVQKMGRKLAEKTHGSGYANVRELNELLHQARVQHFKIQDEAAK